MAYQIIADSVYTPSLVVPTHPEMQAGYSLNTGPGALPGDAAGAYKGYCGGLVVERADVDPTISVVGIEFVHYAAPSVNGNQHLQVDLHVKSPTLASRVVDPPNVLATASKVPTATAAKQTETWTFDAPVTLTHGQMICALWQWVGTPSNANSVQFASATVSAGHTRYGLTFDGASTYATTTSHPLCRLIGADGRNAYLSTMPWPMMETQTGSWNLNTYKSLGAAFSFDRPIKVSEIFASPKLVGLASSQKLELYRGPAADPIVSRTVRGYMAHNLTSYFRYGKTLTTPAIFEPGELAYVVMTSEDTDPSYGLQTTIQQWVNLPMKDLFPFANRQGTVTRNPDGTWNPVRWDQTINMGYAGSAVDTVPTPFPARRGLGR